MKLSDVKFLKMQRKDYGFGGSVETYPVGNFPEWRHFLLKYWKPGIGRKMFNVGCRMTGDNRERFRRHFGKCAFTYDGSHYFHCWVADLGTAEVIVLTAKEHGTCYEVIVSRDGKNVQKDIPRVLEFMEMIGRLPK